MTDSSMSHRIKSRILSIRNYLNKKNPSSSILFATKYLDKYQFISFIQTALDLKITPLLIGENKIQDAKEKLDYLLASQGETLRSQFTYIMIGNLQKNKINKALNIFDEIHSVDSIELAEGINKRIQTHNSQLTTHNPYPIFLEVNIADDPSKHGFKQNEIEEAIKYIKRLKNISISGLMTMSPYTRNPESSRKYFRSLKLYAERWQLKTSMGTSQDWQVAVSEGADIIRIGREIFY